MPSKAPPRGTQLKKILRDLGEQIHGRRKTLKVSAVAVAEVAGISRMTLNRIEHGEASVTLGAYLNVISVLGLNLVLGDYNSKNGEGAQPDVKLPKKIRLADYRQLKRLAWQIKDTQEMTPREVLDLYERNWRHVDTEGMDAEERELIRKLNATLGRGRLLV